MPSRSLASARLDGEFDADCFGKARRTQLAEPHRDRQRELEER